MAEGGFGLPFSGKSVLHVGCGGSPLPMWFAGTKETRLDINGDMKPDIVRDMREIDESVGKYDVIFSNHAIEHLYPHEVVPTFEGFRSALNEGGCVIAIVPNMQGIEPTGEVVYESPSGPITGHDMFYGHHRLIPSNPYMAHHCGFIRETLQAALESAGFHGVTVRADDSFNLIGVGLA